MIARIATVIIAITTWVAIAAAQPAPPARDAGAAAPRAPDGARTPAAAPGAPETGARAPDGAPDRDAPETTSPTSPGSPAEPAPEPSPGAPAIATPSTPAPMNGGSGADAAPGAGDRSADTPTDARSPPTRTADAGDAGAPAPAAGPSGAGSAGASGAGTNGAPGAGPSGTGTSSGTAGASGAGTNGAPGAGPSGTGTSSGTAGAPAGTGSPPGTAGTSGAGPAGAGTAGAGTGTSTGTSPGAGPADTGPAGTSGAGPTGPSAAGPAGAGTTGPPAAGSAGTNPANPAGAGTAGTSGAGTAGTSGAGPVGAGGGTPDADSGIDPTRAGIDPSGGAGSGTDSTRIGSGAGSGLDSTAGAGGTADASSGDGAPGDAGAPDADAMAPPPEPPPAATAQTTTESTLFAIKVIGGLIALLVLAYLGGHHRVVRFQERLGVSGVITAGFPFIALGVVASLPSVGILTGDVLENIRPVLLFGLGWLGFIIGAQLDIRVLERVPRGTAYLILVESVMPFAVTAAACGAVMMLAFGSKWHDLAMWRDVVLLGAAAAMTAPRRFRGFASRSWREGRSADVLLAQLDELTGVIGLLFITAYFRTSGTAWQLPDTAWVFVSLGVGVAVGALIFAMVRLPTTNAEFLAIVLGGIAFASGFAGYLRLSPIVICFIAGVLVTNFPNDARENVFRILRHLERPVHLLFLIVAGAVWSVSDWRGWVLVPVFVIARVAGKWFGIVASRTVLDDQLGSERALITPLSVLSIALVISAEQTYTGSRSISWIVTAVIGGAIISELLVQATPTSDDHPPEPVHKIDELDESSGPVYMDELDERKP